MLKIVVVLLSIAIIECSYLTIINKCNENIFVQSQNGADSQKLSEYVVQLAPGQSYSYNSIPYGWNGNFWPKTGCDSNGNNCQTGQSIPPCPSGGCQPPTGTLIEFNFINTPFYDISLVNGYTIPATVIPSIQNENCPVVNCNVNLSSCPTSEIDGLGNLNFPENGNSIMCLSPCYKDNYPSPYGLGNNIQNQPGLDLCCPSPVSPEQCRSGSVVNTQYVNYIHQACPSAYAYSYDDINGNHACPSGTTFTIQFCGVQMEEN